MTKKTRTIIFLSCFLLFVLIAPSVVLYSQGYRFDLENRKITQTGGLFIRALPKQVDIYLNDKAKGRTDFFFGSVLIQNLLPKRYKVEIKKEGFHPWKKTLEIKEKEVQKVKNIVLFPQNINFNVLARETERFWLSPNQRKIILQEGEEGKPSSSPLAGARVGEEKLGWALKLYDLDRKIKSHLLNETDIFARGVELINLTFSEDSRKIYLQTAAKEQIQYFALDLNKIPAILTETTPPLPLANAREGEAFIAVASARVGNDVYYLDESGRLFKNDAELTSEPFPVKQETEYLLDVFQDYIFLREVNESLYIFNSDLKSFEFFFDKIKSLKISPDNKKLAYFSEHEIWIFPLGNKNYPFQKKTDEKIFLMRLSEKISDVFWVNNDYLIFIAGDKIKISEIDNRDRLNIIDIFEIKKLPREESHIKMIWNQFDKRIYLLNGETLYQSDALLP